MSGSVGDNPAALSEPRGTGGPSQDRGTKYDHEFSGNSDRHGKIYH